MGIAGTHAPKVLKLSPILPREPLLEEALDLAHCKVCSHSSTKLCYGRKPISRFVFACLTLPAEEFASQQNRMHEKNHPSLLLAKGDCVSFVNVVVQEKIVVLQ